MQPIVRPKVLDRKLLHVRISPRARHASLMVEILKDNARPEARAVYGAMDMPWAKLVGQIAQAYGK